MIEDSFTHQSLLLHELVARMGIPKATITFASDGKIALNELSANLYGHITNPQIVLFSMIITDYNIPHLSGQEVILAAK